ncbi:MAG: heavy-metal-associated domain-containing protein [Acetatifactor sp.]|nr:heavy-metal-associated domain-containing protein [Acetatifactor sp.]
MNVLIGIVTAGIFAGLIVFIKRKIQYGSSCCGEKEKPVDRVQAPDADPSHYPYHYVIKVEGMTCNNCARRVENAFHQTGEALARVHLRTKQVKLGYKRSVNRQELAKIIDAAGYTLMEFEEERSSEAK